MQPSTLQVYIQPTVRAGNNIHCMLIENRPARLPAVDLQNVVIAETEIEAMQFHHDIKAKSALNPAIQTLIMGGSHQCTIVRQR